MPEHECKIEDIHFLQTENIVYPKPGMPMPTVTLQLTNLKDVINSNKAKLNVIEPPQALERRDPILVDVKWISDHELCVVWMNRLQTVLKFMICTVANISCHELHSIHKRNAWIDYQAAPIFSSCGSHMLLVESHEQDNHVGSFPHVTMVQRTNIQPAVIALTAGMFTVTRILTWNHEKHLIYFLATAESNSSVLHLYSVPDDPKTAPNCVKCLTCQLPSLYHDAVFSKNNSFYVLQTLGPDVPEILLFSKDHVLVKVWEANEPVKEQLVNTLLPATMSVEVEVPNGYKAIVKLWLPPNYDISKSKYPLLIHVYDFPGMCEINEKFSIDWRTYLTVNRSIAYAVIEGRGSGLKGDRLEYIVYKKLGVTESEDQIFVVKKLLDILNFIESTKIAIWGWNYGGYIAAMALATDVESVFRCGISVAPVTSWIYYSAIHTEKYMGLPTESDNLSGYCQSDLVQKVDHLRDKTFLLIHGTHGSSLNKMHSLLLSKALQENNILFREQIYTEDPNNTHGTEKHLYHSMENFLEECKLLD